MGRSGNTARSSAPARSRPLLPEGYEKELRRHWDGAVPPARARKTEAGTVMYHATFGERRAQEVIREGLRPFSTGLGWEEAQQRWKPSVFFFADARDALRHPGHADTWNPDWQVLAVDVGGLMLRPDPFQSSKHGPCWRVESFVPASRILGVAFARQGAHIEKLRLPARAAA